MKKHKYLTNKELLEEIHKSKSSFCEFVEPHYHRYDIIVSGVEEIFKEEVQEQAKANRAKRIADKNYKSALAEYDGPAQNKPKLSQFKFEPETISNDDLVYRVETFEHIPLAPGRKKNPKKEKEHYVKLNFIPFKHYIIRDGQAIEVGRSHTKDGQFSQTHGSITDRLAHMFILLVNKYSQKSNWRGYTYVDEMIGQSLLQLSSMALQFDEAKSDNPFAYYTASITNSFTRVLNLEKNNQRVRDEILIDRGQTPSFGRQIEHEEQIRQLREEAESND